MSAASQQCRTSAFDSTSPNPTGIASDIVAIANQLQGAGAPAADLGVVGNVYTDVTTGNQYQKDMLGWHPTIAISSFIVIPDPLALTELDVDTIKGNSGQDVQVDLQTTGILKVGPTADLGRVAVNPDGTVVLDATTASLIVADTLGGQITYGPSAMTSTGNMTISGNTQLGLSTNSGNIFLNPTMDLVANAGNGLNFNTATTGMQFNSAADIALSPTTMITAGGQIQSAVGGAQYSSAFDPTTGLSSQIGNAKILVTGISQMQWNNGTTISSSQMQSIDGTAGAPSYSFSSDSSTGMHGGGASVALAVSGADKLACSATQTLSGQHLRPSVDATYDLGSALLQWNNIYLVNAPIVSSDVRLKKDVDTLSSQLGLSFIDSLRPVSYKWKDSFDEREHFGVIAQELEDSLAQRGYEHGRSSLVHVSPEGKYGISPDALIPCLIKAVQQLSARCAELEKKM